MDCWQRSNQVDYPSRRPNPQDQLARQANLSYHHSPSTVVDPNWYFDTRATDHIAPDLQKMNLAEDYHGNDKLQVGNGKNLVISHLGISSLHNLKLPSVLIVPKITKHLLSVSKLTKENNVYLQFWPTNCYVKSLQGKILLRGDVKHGLYRVPPCHKSPHQSSSTLALTGVRTSLQGWHKRLAHPHESLLRKLLQSFQLPISSHNLPIVCDACQLGKSHRLPLTNSQVASFKPFDLVYSDVWGPSPYFSINENRYFLLFVDDCTKFVWIYFLSHESQVLNFFMHFHQMIKTQFNSNIKTLQSDWGGEYRNLSSYLTTHGISHRVSCPYIQEQNGSVERRNRVILEKGLTLLAHSSLPHTFWEHAFKTATYLHNRTITPILSYKSPYQVLYSQVPDYDFSQNLWLFVLPVLKTLQSP